MQNSTILYIDLIADADRIHITPYHHTKPKAALVTGYYITNNNSCFSQVTIFTQLRV